MYGATIALLTIVLTAIPAVARPVKGESPDAYVIVVRAALPILPSPLNVYLESRIEAVQAGALAVRLRAEGRATSPQDEEAHRIALDISAGDGDVKDRSSAAENFPRGRKAAQALQTLNSHHAVGLLPWAIEQRVEALKRVFGDGDADAIAREAGKLLHFSADAVLPFNVTAHRDGFTPDNIRWPDDGEHSPLTSHRTVRHRCHVVLSARLRDRLDHEVRVWPGRCQPPTDLTAAIFNVLLDTHESAEILADLDARILARLDITDAAGFIDRREDYYDRLAAESAELLESRLEAGALLGANLIGLAWQQAGRPTLPGGEALLPSRTAASPASLSSGESPYVGSRNSTLFHRAACSHARRIKPANRIFFPTLQEALTVGRTACKTCKPKSP